MPNGYHCDIGAIRPDLLKGGSRRRGCPAWLLAKIAEDNEVKYRVQPFRSVSQMCESLKLPDSKFKFGWRLTDCRVGYINGLPQSYGQIVATDGIMCVIMQFGQDYNRAFLGHVHYFVEVDVVERVIVERDDESKPRSKSTSISSLIKDFAL